MKGYFSLVQYCPDIARREAANIGVMLLCPEVGFLDIKLTTVNHRVRKFFGEEADNYRHLDQMKAALRERLKVEREGMLSLEGLAGFVSTWTSKVNVTPPKSVKVLSPVDDLLALYKEMVDDPLRNLALRATLPLRKRLDAALGAPRFAPLVQKKVRVDVPALNRPLVAPYGYQNGRFHLVVAEEFTQQSEARIETAACKLAVEGRSLYEHRDAKLGELQLVVVADFALAHEKARQKVARIFDEYHVRLFQSDNLAALENEVETHAKPLILV